MRDSLILSIDLFYSKDTIRISKGINFVKYAHDCHLFFAFQLNERSRKLDIGLLQSGKFQEALDGFAKWLTDTEEMVANQKPPSADYKVVKAQLQEQKVNDFSAIPLTMPSVLLYCSSYPFNSDFA